MNHEELGELLRSGKIDYQTWSAYREMINENPQPNSGSERASNDFNELLRNGTIDYQTWSAFREWGED